MLKNHLLQKRLLAYSAAAGLALAGGVALADTNDINAPVIRNITNQTLGHNQELLINFDNDGQPEFNLKVQATAANQTFLISRVSNTGPTTEYGRALLESGGRKTFALGATIGGAILPMAAGGNQSLDDTEIGAINTDKCIGLRFKLNNEATLYTGWVGFSATGSGATFQVTVKSYGYDTDTSATVRCPNPLAVALANFEAIADGTDVSVRWSTVSEQDNLGFNLYRSTDFDNLGTQLNTELIPAQAPGSGQGFSYNYLDQNLEAGTYFYTLEDVDVNGLSTRHEPVSVTIAEPTAVTLNQLESRPENVGLGLLAAGGALAGVALAARRRRSSS